MKLSNKIFLATGAFAVLASSTAFAGGIDLVKSDAITVNMNGEIDMKITHEHKKGEDDQGTQIETNFDNLGFVLVNGFPCVCGRQAGREGHRLFLHRQIRTEGRTGRKHLPSGRWSCFHCAVRDEPECPDVARHRRGLPVEPCAPC